MPRSESARRVLARSIPEPDPERLADATELAAHAPEPATVRHTLFGTAGWTDKTLVTPGLFYPRGAHGPEARLRHYASKFSLVEVDATYYSLLPPETAARWVGWTPASFRVDVKAHPILTGHPIDIARLPADLARALGSPAGKVYASRMPKDVVCEIERRFFLTTEPLLQAGRLGCVMLQFPPWFTATRGRVRAIESLRERFETVPFAVEFRHRSWFESERRERVFDMLRRQRFSYVIVDEPAPGGVPPIVCVTNSELAVFRFHGQNAAGWRKGASVHERFDWLYTRRELEPWAPRVAAAAREAREVHVVFNNCVRNYAVLNAQGLAVLVGGDP